MTQINWQYQVNNRAGGYIVTATDWNDFAGNFRAFIDQTTGSGTTDNSALPIGVDLVNHKVFISDPTSATACSPEAANNTATAQFQVSSNAQDATIAITAAHDTEATSAVLLMRKADGTQASPALVDDNAVLGTIQFQGYDGNSWANGATIQALVDGTAGDGDMPTELIFSTSADGAESPTARMTIQPDGFVGIGADMTPARLFQVTVADSGVTPATDHHVLIENSGDMGLLIGSGNTSNGYIRFGDDGSSSAGGFNYDHDINKLWFRVNATDKLNIDNSGLIRSPRSYAATTGNAANLYVDTDGGFYRSTSSIRFKTDVETMEDKYADAVLGLRPVWYKSTATADRKDWSHWGLIAEEVEAIDPRLVYYGPEPEVDSNGNDLYEEDAKGNSQPVYKKDSGGKVIEEPQGVQYDRLVPHLLNLLKRQDARIKALESA